MSFHLVLFYLELFVAALWVFEAQEPQVAKLGLVQDFLCCPVGSLGSNLLIHVPYSWKWQKCG